MEKVDNILKKKGLKYVILNYKDDECYLIESLKLYFYIKEKKKTENYIEFKSFVPNGYKFISYTKLELKHAKDLKCFNGKEAAKKLSDFQDGGNVVRHYADKMRENPTKAEDKLSQVFQAKGIEYKQQVMIDCKVKKYIADFLVGNTVVEVDGKSHRKKRAREYDAVRTERLEALGYVVVRIQNKDVLKETVNLRNLIYKLKN